MLRHLMPTCQELADAAASDSVGNLSWFDRLRHWFHGRMCPPCRHYTRQIESIGDTARHASKDCEPCTDELDAMKARCLDALKARKSSDGP